MTTSVALAIAADHPAFAGHFPSQPIVPGVVLLDVGLRALAHALPPTSELAIASAKFLSTVGPGEPVRLECDAAANGWRLRVYAGIAADERLAVNALLRHGDD